jgi:hypothetical protein
VRREYVTPRACVCCVCVYLEREVVGRIDLVVDAVRTRNEDAHIQTVPVVDQRIHRREDQQGQRLKALYTHAKYLTLLDS